MFSKLKKLTRRKSPKSKTLSTKKSKLSNMFTTIKGSSLIGYESVPKSINKLFL
jgi:hypothetical protein